MTALDDEDLVNRFTYHAPTPDQIEWYREIRDTAHEFARRLVDLVPPGRERDLAVTHLEQTVMWANAGIARSGSTR